MHILIVSATEREIEPLVRGLGGGPLQPSRAGSYRCGGHEVAVLTTGVGMVATAVGCASYLAVEPCDLAINLGLCGSFDGRFEPGAVVHVVTERIAELGAEDGDDFLSIEQLSLPA